MKNVWKEFQISNLLGGWTAYKGKSPNLLTLLPPGFACIVCFRQPISNESNNQLELEPALPSLTVLSVPGKLKQMIFFLPSNKKAIIILMCTSGSKTSFGVSDKTEMKFNTHNVQSFGNTLCFSLVGFSNLFLLRAFLSYLTLLCL